MSWSNLDSDHTMELVAAALPGGMYSNNTHVPEGPRPPDQEWYWMNDTGLDLDLQDFKTRENGYRTGGSNSLDQEELQMILNKFRDNLFAFSEPTTVLLICLYIPIFIVAFVGNILVLLVVLPNRFMRNVTNCFIVNLAVADLLVTMICMPMAIGQSIHKPWIYGAFMCKVTTYMQGVAVSASVFTLMALSVDRFLAIRHPMTFRSFSTYRYAVSILTTLWVLSFCMMIPLVLVRQLETFQPTQEVKPVYFCTEFWNHLHGRQIYDTFLFAFMFVMPGCFITASYSLIGCKLWTEKRLLHRRDSQAGREQTEKVMSGRRRVARMLVMLAIVFAVCWMPYHLHSLYLDYTDPYALDVIEALPFTILIGHANSALNPILYCFLNKSFRRTAARLLHIKTERRPKSKRKQSPPVNIVVKYQKADTVQPNSPISILKHPLLRTGSSSSMNGSRSNSGSLRQSRSTPNTTRTSMSSSMGRRSMDRRRAGSLVDGMRADLNEMRVFRAPFTTHCFSDRVIQQEVYPSFQAVMPATVPKKRVDFKNNGLSNNRPIYTETENNNDHRRNKKEIFSCTISIPTTIQEESSRSSKTPSPLMAKRSFLGEREMRDILDHQNSRRSEYQQFIIQHRPPPEIILEDQYEDSSDSEGGDVHPESSTSSSQRRVLEQIDIQIHVPAQTVPTITCEEIT